MYPDAPSGMLLTLTYKFASSIITYILAHNKLPKMSFHLDRFPALLWWCKIALLTQESAWKCLVWVRGDMSMKRPCVGGVWAWIQFKPPMELHPLPPRCDHSCQAPPAVQSLERAKPFPSFVNISEPLKSREALN